ncbi:MAG: phytoene desaturase family protein [Flammeovirgaceae bacterium]
MDQKKIIIIGGGISGLSAGVYAQKNGYEATIIEMHDKPGGQLTAWDRSGYRFDYCLHWLVGTDHGVYYDIWNEIGAMDQRTEVINHPIFVKIQDEQHGEFYIYNDLDEWEAYLIQMAPEDESAIAKLCRMMRKSDQLDQFDDPPELRSFFDYFKSFVKMGSFFPILIRYGKSTAKELFDHVGLTNERVRYFLAKLYEGRDFSALGLIMMMGWAHAKNAGYLKGGSNRMTQRIAATYRGLGGKFLYNSAVKEIIVENDQAKGVTLRNGEHYFADYVISACDGHAVLYDMLKGNYLTKKLQDAYETWPLFTPLVMIGFGIDDEIASPAHNTNYYPTDTLHIGSTQTAGYSIMNRSMYDEAFAPAGKTTLLLQFESPWELWQDLEGDGYLKEKSAIRQKAIELLEQHYPNITEKIEIIDIATPKTTARYTGVWKGAYEGFMPSKNVMNGLPMELDGLKNFMMIGQWLFPGGGLPPSAQSGKWAIQKITHAEGKEFVVDRMPGKKHEQRDSLTTS